MDNMDYKIGLMESQVTETRDDVADLKTTVAEMQKDLKEIKTQLVTWRSAAAGAIAVLSFIGAGILWLSDSIIGFIKIKLGM